MSAATKRHPLSDLPVNSGPPPAKLARKESRCSRENESLSLDRTAHRNSLLKRPIQRRRRLCGLSCNADCAVPHAVAHIESQASIEQSVSFRKRLNGISTARDLHSVVPSPQSPDASAVPPMSTVSEQCKTAAMQFGTAPGALPVSTVPEKCDHTATQSRTAPTALPVSTVPEKCNHTATQSSTAPTALPVSTVPEKCKPAATQLGTAPVYRAVSKHQPPRRKTFNTDLSTIEEEMDSLQQSPIFLCPTRSVAKSRSKASVETPTSQPNPPKNSKTEQKILCGLHPPAVSNPKPANDMKHKISESKKPLDLEKMSNAPSLCEPNAEIPFSQHNPPKCHKSEKDTKCKPLSVSIPNPTNDVKLTPSQNESKKPVSLEQKPTASDHEEIVVNRNAYTTLSLLGKGGSSKVFQVIDPRNYQLKAIKCVNLEDSDQRTCDMYLKEIDLLGKLQDADCIIRMFDFEYVKERKMLYVVMERGDTDFSRLMRNLRTCKKISSAMIVYYWTEMLNAVDFIHKQGIIHSDLKPANFLLVSGHLKLIDFGVSSTIHKDMTSIVKDSMGGTFDYISPESLTMNAQVGAYKIGYKSDVWSLGCILFNLLFGQSPFQHIRNISEKVAAILGPKYEIKFPKPLIEDFRPVLVQALKMCLVRNPKERASVAELLHLPYIEIGPEKGIHSLLSQVASIAASVGVVEKSEDDPYAVAAHSIQKLIMKNERVLNIIGKKKQPN